MVGRYAQAFVTLSSGDAPAALRALTDADSAKLDSALRPGPKQDARKSGTGSLAVLASVIDGTLDGRHVRGVYVSRPAPEVPQATFERAVKEVMRAFAAAGASAPAVTCSLPALGGSLLRDYRVEDAVTPGP